MSTSAFSPRLILSQIEEAAINLNQAYKFLRLELKRVDQSQGSAIITFQSKLGATHAFKIANKGKFPIDPPSIVFVDPTTFVPSVAAWPNQDHFFGPGRFDRYPEGFICVSVTWEYRDFKHFTDWGLENDGKDKIRTLEAALQLILTQANFI